MVQLNILSGKKAGTQAVARRFPFRVGRAPGNDLQLEDDGIWDQHFSLDLNRQQGFTLATASNALTSVNGETVQAIALRNGDVITAGSARLQFWLTVVRQRGLHLREAFIWSLLAVVTAGQFALIYWLLR